MKVVSITDIDTKHSMAFPFLKGQIFEICLLNFILLNFSEVTSSCRDIDQPTCLANEILCPGAIDENGCKTVSICTSNENMDHFGFPCTAICQPHCSSDEKYCPGTKDANGCITLGDCIKSVKIGSDGALCLPRCSIECSGNQIMCLGDLDSNGCKSEDYCVEKGMFCKI